MGKVDEQTFATGRFLEAFGFVLSNVRFSSPLDVVCGYRFFTVSAVLNFVTAEPLSWILAFFVLGFIFTGMPAA